MGSRKNTAKTAKIGFTIFHNVGLTQLHKCWQKLVVGVWVIF